MLGDGTGAGKGRQVAGIILDNWLKGRRRAVWISKSDKLIEDGQCDWPALGQERLLVTSLARFRQGTPVRLEQGILFATHATLRTDAREERVSRVRQIVDWLGSDFDGAIVFDESHALANAAGGKGERCGLGVLGPVGPEGDLRHLAMVGSASGNALGALRRTAVQQHHACKAVMPRRRRYTSATVMVTTRRELLTFTRRGTGARDYHRLKAALDRLQSTTVATSLRQTTERRMHQFSWINEWTERADAHGNADGIDLIMPDWFYRAVLDDALVLTIDPAYFGLTGGLERWLYRLVPSGPAVSAAAGGSTSAISTPSRRASRCSSALHSSCATSRVASPCRATGCPSSSRPADATCWRSRPHSFPQGPLDNLWNRTCFRDPMGRCHQEPDTHATRNRMPGFPQAVQSLPGRLT
jgi:hypothetical protein